LHSLATQSILVITQFRNVVSYADEVVAKYRPKQKAIVYYNSRRPNLSVLEPGTSKTTFQPLIFVKFWLWEVFVFRVYFLSLVSCRKLRLYDL
jgi:hypothetical protein